MNTEHQPVLAELCNCQQCLADMKEDLDQLSDKLVDNAETLTHVRALHNTLSGTRGLIRTMFHTRRTA